MKLGKGWRRDLGRVEKAEKEHEGPGIGRVLRHCKRRRGMNEEEQEDTRARADDLK